MSSTNSIKVHVLLAATIYSFLRARRLCEFRSTLKVTIKVKKLHNRAIKSCPCIEYSGWYIVLKAVASLLLLCEIRYCTILLHSVYSASKYLLFCKSTL